MLNLGTELPWIKVFGSSIRSAVDEVGLVNWIEVYEEYGERDVL